MIITMVKKCDYEPCDKLDHYFKECCLKYFHLKKTFEKRLDFNKNRRVNKKDKRAKKEKKKKKKKKAKKKEAKKKKEIYDAIGVFASHSAFAVVAFSKLVAVLLFNRPSINTSANIIANVIALDFVMFWFLDIDASYHITGNRNVFTSFTSMSSRTVGGIGGDLKAGKYDFVRLFCKGGRSFTINNVLYVKNCFYNFLSFSQLHNDGCFLFIIKNGFFIDINDIQALFRCGLYFVQLEDFVVCVSVNFDTLRMWHERFGHLGNQNVIKLAHSVGIDLSKLFFSDFCFLCDRGAGKIEFHKDYIASGRHQADLIHGDLMGLFSVRGYNGAVWVAAWFDDKIKQSHVDILLSKEGFGVLTSFKSFLGRIEHGMNRCTRIRIDNGKEYLNEGFMEYIAERGIRFEPITVGNSQMNGCAERFNQIIMRKANIFLKDNDIVLKWWPELVHAANHLRNICFVTGLIDSNGKPITSFHVSTGRSYDYHTFRRIGQRDEYQVIKPAIGYKKFDDHKASGVLISYEKEHIYRIIIEKSKIKRCFNVKWYNNLTARSIEKEFSQRFSPFKLQPASPQPISVSLAFSFNEIDRFFDELFLQIDDERLKFTSVFRQHAFQAARNPMMVISRVNNSLQYTTLSTPASSAPASRGSPTPSASGTPSSSGRTPSVSGRNPPASGINPSASGKIPGASSSNSPTSGSNPPAAGRDSPAANSTPSASSASSTGTLTPMSIDKLVIDSIAQEIRLPNASSAETELQRALNHHFEL